MCWGMLCIWAARSAARSLCHTCLPLSKQSVIRRNLHHGLTSSSLVEYHTWYRTLHPIVRKKRKSWMCFTPRDGVNINFDWQVCTKCQWLAKIHLVNMPQQKDGFLPELLYLEKCHLQRLRCYYNTPSQVMVTWICNSSSIEHRNIGNCQWHLAWKKGWLLIFHANPWTMKEMSISTAQSSLKL